MVRIGLLIDGLKVKKWQHEIIKFIETHPKLDLSAFIINANTSEFAAAGAFFYRSSQYLDRKIFSVKHDVFEEYSLEGYKENIPLYYIKGEEKRYSYKFPVEDLKRMKELDLDIMIRFGFGILRGDVLKIPNEGIWSLHHGDNRINRGGPPAFWEVVNKEEVTGITLQQLSENLDGGRVIKRSFIKTNHTSFYRNKNEAFWAGVELFKIALNDLSQGKLNYEHDCDSLDFYSHPLYKDPDNLTSIKILFLFWSRRIVDIIKEKLKEPQWYILYKFKRDNLFEKSIFRYRKLLPPKGYDWADPFIIKENDKFYLFLEEKKISLKNGHISYIEFDKNGNPLNPKPIKIISEDYHLSYPFIWKEAADYYMLPESAAANELWLYKCVSFPDKWNKYQKIFSDKEIYDATLFYKDGYWYLFGTEKLSVGGSRDQYLHIYYSRDLFNSEWISHPQNPQSFDVRGARPAGKIFQYEGKIYRPTQIGAPKYGYGIQVNQITELSTENFSEIKADEILPKWDMKLLATHTLNFEEGFTVIDAQGEI